MQISELSRRTGVSVHAIRHDEQSGLITARRRPSGYREFDDAVIRELRFIVMSRQCGFSLQQIGETLPAYRRRTLTPARMIAMLEDRIADIDGEIAARRTLRQHLVDHIAWFQAREKPAASARPAFPKAPSRGSIDTRAGPAGKRTRR